MTNEYCEHLITQTDNSGCVAICFCTHDDNADDYEGNCTKELCPVQGAYKE